MKRLLLILALLIPTQAFAVTQVTRYLNTACSSNGDGTSSSCAASPGGGGAYTTLFNANTDIASDFPDFVSADVQVTIDCRGSTADSTAVIIAAIPATNATHYLAITSSVGNRHSGAWDTSKYHLEGSDYFAMLQIQNPFVRVSFLQIGQTYSGANPGVEAHGIKLSLSGVTAGRIELKQNIVRYTGDYTNQLNEGFTTESDWTSGVDEVYVNNIFYDWKIGMRVRSVLSDNVYLYNNTSYSNAASGEALHFTVIGAGTTFVYKNNLANGTAIGYAGSEDGVATVIHSNNISEDTSSPDASFRSKAVTFVNEGGRDLHLGAADTNATDAAADLSAVTEGFTNDIDNQTRQVTWDIGADDSSIGAGPTPTPTPTPVPTPTPTPGPTPTPTPTPVGSTSGCAATQNFDISQSGAINKCFHFFAQSQTNCFGLQGLAYNTAGLKCWYRGDGDNTSHQITLNDSTLGTYTNGAFKEETPGLRGWYEFCPPPESLAGNPGTTTTFECFGASDMTEASLRVVLSPQADVGFWNRRPVVQPDLDGEPKVTVSFIGDNAIRESVFTPRGTAQSAGPQTLQLAPGEIFGDDDLAGNASVHIANAATGTGQTRCICSNNSATDTVTLCKPWRVQPTGTIQYILQEAANCTTELADASLTGAKLGDDVEGHVKTAQSVSTQGIRLAAVESYADNILKENNSVWVPSAASGKGQLECICGNTLSNDQVTLCRPWRTVPSGTVAYAIVHTPNCNMNSWPKPR